MDLLIAKRTLDVFAKALLLFAGFQFLFVFSLGIGFTIEKQSVFEQDSNIFSLFNHRHLAWTGLFLTLIGLPLAGVLGRFATKKYSRNFYFLGGSWHECITGFFTGTIFILFFFSLLILTGYARLTAFPDRLTPQELIASPLAYALIMLLIAFNNELVYRGILIGEWTSLWKNRFSAVLTTGLIYGLMRAWSIQGTFSQRLLLFFSGFVFSWLMAGIMFYKKSLKYTIGVHAGCYYCLSALLGIASVGNRLNVTPFVTEIHGSSIVFGGILGIENSLLFNVTLLVITLILWRKITIKSPRAPLETDNHIP